MQNIFIGRSEVSEFEIFKKEIQPKLAFRLISSCTTYSELALVSAHAIDFIVISIILFVQLFITGQILNTITT